LKRKRADDSESESDSEVENLIKRGHWNDEIIENLISFEEPVEDEMLVVHSERPMTDFCTGVISLKGRILDCNSKFGEVIGYPREHLLDRMVFSIFSEHERFNILKNLQKLFNDINTDNSLCFETNILHSNSQTVSLKVMIRPLYDESNELKALLWVAKPTQRQIHYQERLALTFHNEEDIEMSTN
jgi:PAS domain S-box-containing protein